MNEIKDKAISVSANTLRHKLVTEAAKRNAEVWRWWIRWNPGEEPRVRVSFCKDHEVLETRLEFPLNECHCFSDDDPLIFTSFNSPTYMACEADRQKDNPFYPK